MESLGAAKANKIDTQLAMRWVEIINRQLKQIVVLVTEMLRFEVDKKDLKMFEGEQHIQHNRAFLFQQSLLISQWINKFSTQQVNEYFLESSAGVTELNWTPPEVLAFQRYAEEKLKDVDLEVLITRNAALAQNLKMRSKSLMHGGQQNLAMTARGFMTTKHSPRAGKTGLRIENPAMIMNNKVTYSNIEVTEQSVDYQSPEKTDARRHMRATSGFKIHTTQDSLVFGTGSMARQQSGQTSEEKQRVDWKNLASQNRHIFNKTLMLGRGSNLGFATNAAFVDASKGHLNLASERSGMESVRAAQFPGIK